MAFTVQTIISSMSNYFSGRNIISTQCAENVRKAVLELSENYKFPGLQRTGPTQPLTLNYAGPYDYNAFLNTPDMGLEINKFDSFFIYYQGLPVQNSGQANAGYPLKFSTIDNLEILINIPGLPTKWTRHEGYIYFAQAPNQIYYIYLRYQIEHPFPNAGTVNAGIDPILLPNSWQDIVELATAERQASDFNLDERMQKFHQRLYGDPKFQATGGTEGSPGIIFSRTSQEQRDQTTTTKSMRLMIRQVSR